MAGEVHASDAGTTEAAGADLVARGLAARRAGDRASARALFEQAVGRDPAHVAARLELASELRWAGRHDAAAAIHRDLLVSQPQLLPAMLGLGLALRHLGDRAAALAQFRAAVASIQGRAARVSQSLLGQMT